MSNTPPEDNFDDENLGPSKSELKRRMTRLRQLADQLTHLPEADLLSFELPAVAVESIQTAARLKSSNARNRQLRHASKLLEKSGDEMLEAISGFFESKQLKAQSMNQRHKEIEKWRDRLLVETNDTLNELIEKFPDIDRQALRTLARLAAKELSQQKPPTQQRKLFRYLRDNVFN